MFELQNVSRKKKINKWLSGVPCKRKANGLERKAAFEERHSDQVKIAKLAKESYQIFDTDSEDELLPPQKEKTFTMKAPTTEDQQEADGFNEWERRGGGPNGVKQKLKLKENSSGPDVDSELERERKGLGKNGEKNKPEKAKVQNQTGGEEQENVEGIGCDPKGLRKIFETNSVETALAMLLTASKTERKLRNRMRRATTIEDALVDSLESSGHDFEEAEGETNVKTATKYFMITEGLSDEGSEAETQESDHESCEQKQGEATSREQHEKEEENNDTKMSGQPEKKSKLNTAIEERELFGEIASLGGASPTLQTAEGNLRPRGTSTLSFCKSSEPREKTSKEKST